MLLVLQIRNLPVFQVWHPLSAGSSVYSKIGQVQFQFGNQEFDESGQFFLHSSVSLTEDNYNPIEFQSGDLVGYYQPSSPRRVVWNVNNTEYTSYVSNVSDLTTTTVNISSIDYVEFSSVQPLINIMFGKQNGF